MDLTVRLVDPDGEHTDMLGHALPCMVRVHPESRMARPGGSSAVSAKLSSSGDTIMTSHSWALTELGSSMSYWSGATSLRTAFMSSGSLDLFPLASPSSLEGFTILSAAAFDQSEPAVQVEGKSEDLG